MSYELAWEPLGVMLSFSGRISFDDIHNATVDYQGDSRFDHIRYVIADLSRISGCDVASTDMDYLWAIDRAAKISNPRIRQAVIAAQPEVIALVTHYKTQGTCAFPTEVFTSLDDARCWLGIGEAGWNRPQTDLSRESEARSS